jgi:hypothetical protein
MLIVIMLIVIMLTCVYLLYRVIKIIISCFFLKTVIMIVIFLFENLIS